MQDQLPVKPTFGSREKISTVVYDALRSAMEPEKARALTLSDRSHLLSDLGLTSLDFADIAIGLEAGLGLREFPIEDWLAAEGRRADKHALTVGSLVDTCVDLTAGTAQEPAPASAEVIVQSSKARLPMGLIWAALTVALCLAAGLAIAMR